MADLHLDRRQLDHLMGVVRRERYQLAMATGTRGGLDQVYLGWCQQGGTRSLVARAPPTFARELAPLARGFFKRRIRRRGFAGSLGGFPHLPLQGIDLVLELADMLLKASDMLLNRWRGNVPLQVGKGQGPQEGGGGGLR